MNNLFTNNNSVLILYNYYIFVYCLYIIYNKTVLVEKVYYKKTIGLEHIINFKMMKNVKKICKIFKIPIGFKIFITFFKNKTENQGFDDISSFIIVFLNCLGIFKF